MSSVSRQSSNILEWKEGLALLSLLRILMLVLNPGQAVQRSSVGLPLNNIPGMSYIAGVRSLKNAAQ